MYNVLIVDDHPIITKAYKRAFEKIGVHKNESFMINVAADCDNAYTIIKNYSINKKPLDIVFLDIQLPPSSDGKILSGEDLGVQIKALFPASKIIMATTFNDNYRIHNIFRSINPEGLLIKNDLDPDDLSTIITTILNNSPYYSETVLQLLRKKISDDFTLDHIDRKLLYELSLGAKTKDLPTILPLSITGIEKRKRHLKEILKVESDRDLLKKAKEKGFI